MPHVCCIAQEKYISERYIQMCENKRSCSSQFRHCCSSLVILACTFVGHLDETGFCAFYNNYSITKKMTYYVNYHIINALALL